MTSRHPNTLRMRSAFLLVLTMLCAIGATAPPTTTPGGIPLDAPWKQKLFALAHERFVHPAWGWQHSERNYLLGVELAKGDRLAVDLDVLFAAAFLHDMSAFMPCADEHMEHGDCAAQQSGAILRDVGFPMQKLPAVQAAERGHMFYRNPGADPAAIVLHDADSLDFLGYIGAARMIALTGEKAASFDPAIATLQTFVEKIPPRLITATAKQIGAERAAELRLFIAQLRREEAAEIDVP